MEKIPEKQYAGASLADEGKVSVYDGFLHKAEPKPLVGRIIIDPDKRAFLAVFGDSETVKEYREAKTCLMNGITPEDFLVDKDKLVAKVRLNLISNAGKC